MAQTHTRFPLRRKTDAANLADAREALAHLIRAGRALVAAHPTKRTAEKIEVYADWLDGERRDSDRYQAEHMATLAEERQRQAARAIALNN